MAQITTGLLEVERRTGNLKFWVDNILASKLNGRLAGYQTAGSQGDLVVDFVKNRDPNVPHGAFGALRLYDGTGATVFEIPSLEVEIEQGPDEMGWKVVTSFYAHGFATDGRAFIFRSTGVPQGTSDTILYVEFGTSDSLGLKGFVETDRWAMGK